MDNIGFILDERKHNMQEGKGHSWGQSWKILHQRWQKSKDRLFVSI